MSIKLKSNEVSVRIPTLTGKSNYRAWEEAIKRYLGSLKLRLFIDYDVEEPVLGLDQGCTIPHDAKIKEYIREKKFTFSEDSLKKLPIDLQNSLKVPVEYELYEHKKPHKAPRHLVGCLLKGHVLIIDEKR